MRNFLGVVVAEHAPYRGRREGPFGLLVQWEQDASITWIPADDDAQYPSEEHRQKAELALWGPLDEQEREENAKKLRAFQDEPLEMRSTRASAGAAQK